MKIELKNIRYNATLSEETACFSASLYVDGKKIGTVVNHGHGGSDTFKGDDAAYKAANEWIRANEPPTEFAGKSLPMDMEGVCARLLDEHLIAKDLRRSMRSRVLFYTPEQKQIMELRWKGVRTINARHIEVARREKPSAVILNTLPFDEALAAYRKYAALA